MNQIQERDQRLLRVIYEQQFVLMSQIERWFFGKQSARRARQRIQVLSEAGWLQRVESPLIKHARIIRLTKSGVSIAETDRVERIPQTRTLDVSTLLHDSIVTSVRLRLEELWDAFWVPERLIKAEQFSHIPDGLVIFDASRLQVAVEVENSPKGPKRFHEIQQRWRGSKVELILYVASSPTMFRIVQNYLKTGPQDLPFALVLWSELEAGVPHAWTVAGEIDVFSRRDLE